MLLSTVTVLEHFIRVYISTHVYTLSDVVTARVWVPVSEQRSVTVKVKVSVPGTRLVFTTTTQHGQVFMTINRKHK